MKWIKIIGLSVLALLLVVTLVFFYSINKHVDIGRFQEWYEIPTGGTPPTNALTVQFVGVSTMVFSDGVTTLMTDGFFTRPSALELIAGKIEPRTEDIKWGIKRLGITALDAIFVVHSHFDHAMDAPIVAQLTGAPMYGSTSTANIGRGLSLQEQQIKLFEDRKPIQVGAFKVTPILSKHYEFPNSRVKEQALGGNQEINAPLIPPVAAMDYKMGGAYTLLFEHPYGSFLLHSSAGWKENGLDDIKADIVIMGIGGLGAQTAEYQGQYFEEIVDKLGPEKVYIVHWDALVGSIRKPIQAEILLLDKLMGKTIAGFEAVEREMTLRPTIPFFLLPQWEKTVLFDGPRSVLGQK